MFYTPVSTYHAPAVSAPAVSTSASVSAPALKQQQIANIGGPDGYMLYGNNEYSRLLIVDIDLATSQLLVEGTNGNRIPISIAQFISIAHEPQLKQSKIRSIGGPDGFINVNNSYKRAQIQDINLDTRELTVRGTNGVIIQIPIDDFISIVHEPQLKQTKIRSIGGPDGFINVNNFYKRAYIEDINLDAGLLSVRGTNGVIIQIPIDDFISIAHEQQFYQDTITILGGPRGFIFTNSKYREVVITNISLDPDELTISDTINNQITRISFPEFVSYANGQHLYLAQQAAEAAAAAAAALQPAAAALQPATPEIIPHFDEHCANLLHHTRFDNRPLPNPAVPNPHRAGYRNLVDNARDYLVAIGMTPQLEFMRDVWDSGPTPTRDALQSYVRLSAPLTATIETQHPAPEIALINQLFVDVPALSHPLTVFRQYTSGAPPHIHDTAITEYARFTSTTLSCTIATAYGFEGDPNAGGGPYFVRIDLLPGMKVLPLVNWSKWGGGVGGNTPKQTELEILLPLRARLYVVPNLPMYRHLRLPRQMLDIINNAHAGTNPNGMRQTPQLNNHFVFAVSNSGTNTLSIGNGVNITTGQMGGGYGHHDEDPNHILKLLTIYKNNKIQETIIKPTYNDDMYLAEKILKIIYRSDKKSSDKKSSDKKSSDKKSRKRKHVGGKKSRKRKHVGGKKSRKSKYFGSKKSRKWNI